MKLSTVKESPTFNIDSILQHRGHEAKRLPLVVTTEPLFERHARNRSTALKGLLLVQGDKQVVVINFPWYLKN